MFKWHRSRRSSESEIASYRSKIEEGKRLLAEGEKNVKDAENTVCTCWNTTHRNIWNYRSYERCKERKSQLLKDGNDKIARAKKIIAEYEDKIKDYYSRKAAEEKRRDELMRAMLAEEEAKRKADAEKAAQEASAAEEEKEVKNLISRIDYEYNVSPKEIIPADAYDNLRERILGLINNRKLNFMSFYDNLSVNRRPGQIVTEYDVSNLLKAAKAIHLYDKNAVAGEINRKTDLRGTYVANFELSIAELREKMKRLFETNNSLYDFDSYLRSVHTGELIKKTPQSIIELVATRHQICVCNCNYSCTCNCNYCTCQCNYSCTCNCNYKSCACQCNYSCTCQCNYTCTCQCNYSGGHRNTCGGHVSSGCSTHTGDKRVRPCSCQCNYSCTCNCNYTCTCNCNYDGRGNLGKTNCYLHNTSNYACVMHVEQDPSQRIIPTQKGNRKYQKLSKIYDYQSDEFPKSKSAEDFKLVCNIHYCPKPGEKDGCLGHKAPEYKYNKFGVYPKSLTTE